MIIANMTWNPQKEGGKDMSLRLAQILYKLFGITTTVENGQIKHEFEFLK